LLARRGSGARSAIGLRLRRGSACGCNSHIRGFWAMMVNGSLTGTAPMSDQQRDGGWKAYYEATAGRPPRRTLLSALERFGAGAPPGRAVDLGCGDGRDTIELLRRGWSVIAIDAEPEAIARLQARPDLPRAAKLVAQCGRFEDLSWPAAALVNASFALPICRPADFPALWEKLTRSLAPGGRFAGQLYGLHDSWAANPAMTFFDEESARRLFDDYAIELFETEESDAVTPRGVAKHWHMFHVVARKS
jgi:SAM-dependent methyltransferase